MRQLSMIAMKTDAYDDAGDELRGLLRDVIENLGVVEVAGSLGVTPRAIYQALSGRDNRKAPVDWLPALLDLDGEGRLIKRLCELAGGDFVPRDRRSPEEKLAALTSQVEQFGEAGLAALRRAGLK